MKQEILTKIIRVYGIVQGVGFRPTVARHAHTAGVTGQVANKGPYVEIYARGTPRQLDRFLELVEHQAPSRAAILKMDVKDVTDLVGENVCLRRSGEADRTFPLRENAAPGTREDAAVAAGSEENAVQFDDFRIVESEKTTGEIYIPPDIAICDDCKRELFDPSNRRYLHPFINCTVCGPRLTIIDGLPYDRERTSMKMFPMCPDCAREYHDPASRRYDAQPVCCNHCGPEVYILAADGSSAAPGQTESGGAAADCREGEEPAGNPGFHAAADGHAGRCRGNTASLRGHAAISYARRVIADGGIVAVKGIGGFHLCCDASNEEAVAKLRQRKNRPMKPFAVMMRDETVAARECEITPAQMEVLTGHQKPILLLPKRRRKPLEHAQRRDIGQGENVHQTAIPADRSEGQGGDAPALCEAVAPDNPCVGVMLPYAPVQLLLFRYDDGIEMPDMLVMTSGNVSGAPIARTDEDALTQIGGFCDCILSNNRPIRVRADDSVMDFYDGAPYMIRRSRGYAPLPYILGREMQGRVLAIGGELKNTFCIGVNSLLYPSSYVGDLADVRSQEALQDSVELMESLLETRPELIAADLHPGYQSTRVALELGEKYQVPVIRVQHHYAHILSCMAENDCLDRCIGISLDGTGYGTDGTVWGGEVLLADPDGFTREASIVPFLQIGGDVSSREGWRIAVSMLCSLFRNDAQDGSGRVEAVSSGERLTDAVQTLGLCDAAAAKIQFMMHEKKLNAIASTSCGRLFDAVAAVLGIRRASTFEGEASNALMFRALAYEEEDAAGLPEELSTLLRVSAGEKAADGRDLLPTDALVGWIVQERLRWLKRRSGKTGEGNGIGKYGAEDANAKWLAYVFHAALAQMVTEEAVRVRQKTGVNVVALSGGCYQNRLLLRLSDETLQREGFRVLRHHLVPPNDGGICLGQALYAMNRLQKESAGR